MAFCNQRLMGWPTISAMSCYATFHMAEVAVSAQMFAEHLPLIVRAVHHPRRRE